MQVKVKKYSVMGCNCKANEKLNGIERIAESDWFTKGYENKNIIYYIANAINWFVYALKMICVVLSILIITPFISLYIAFSAVKRKEVKIAIPKKFR